MPIHGITPGELWDYVPVRCREDDKETQPVFELEVLPLRERTDLMNSAGTVVLEDRENPQTGKVEKTEVFAPETGKTVLKTLRKGLKGWRNWKDGKGELIEPQLQGHQQARNRQLKDESLDTLPDWLAIELSNAIQRGNTLTEDDKGN